MKRLRLLLETFYSRRRRAIFKAFNNENELLSPSQAAKRVKQYYPEVTVNHCSDELRWMERHGIAKCTNPWDHKGRDYVLLEAGKELWSLYLDSDMADEFSRF